MGKAAVNKANARATSAIKKQIKKIKKAKKK